MNQEILKQAGINYLAGVRRFAGKEALYEKFLKKFEEDPNFSGARAALKEEDYDTVLKQIHALKGVSGNLSMDELFENCSAVVDAIRQGEFEVVHGLFQKAEESYQRCCEAITAAQCDN